MRKLVVSAIIMFIIIFAMPVKSISEDTGYSDQSDDIKVIPDEAIRLRILANSDSEKDQALKRKVRDEVNDAITEWVEHMTDIDEARELIESRIPEINTIVNDVLASETNQQDANVEYGKNVTFPAKLYGSYMYPPGEYEAVLITLGEGQGANWWCVLFPPLCFLDFSNGTSVAEAEEDKPDEEAQDKEDGGEDEAEVKFFLFEWFS